MALRPRRILVIGVGQVDGLEKDSQLRVFDDKGVDVLRVELRKPW